MMSAIRKGLVLAVAAGGISLAASSAFAQTVRVNWQTKAAFDDYKTYAWKTSKKQGSGFYRQWVRKDVDAELARKGLKKVALAGNPDLLVLYSFTTQELMDSTTTDDGFGWGGGPWGWWGGWGGWGDMGPDISATEAQPRLMGILSVDLVDAKHKALVWRGQATEDSVSDTQKGDEKQVLKSVDKMFKQYPPGSEKK
jgi:hypothetical protein